MICAGESVELSVPASLTNVSWSPAAGLNTTTGTTVEASRAATTIYTLTYDGLCGDPESTSVEIEVKSLTLPLFLTQVDCDCNIFVPDAFAPDNDGLNDRFKPEIDCVPTEYLFQVFDRWAEVIYQTNSHLAGWIGETHTDLENPGGQGHYNPAGIYHWRVVMMHDANPSGTMQRVSRAGSVVMIR